MTAPVIAGGRPAAGPATPVPLGRRGAQELLRLARRATAFARALPDFLIIGAQKSGTTSLYRYLVQHPGIAEARREELHFFDLHWDRGVVWYRAGFPAARTAARRPQRLTGEATPVYLFDPRVPARVRAVLPRVALIALLRNPVDRAHSQYQHARAKGYEPRATFEQAIGAEEERAGSRLTGTDGLLTAAARHGSYLARGRYAEQLDRWWAHFPREQLLVVLAEELFARPAEVTGQVAAFLGVEPHAATRYAAHNARTYDAMDARTRARLAAHFAPHNARLAGLLGRELPW